MSTRRKTQHNTKDVAKLRNDDLHMELTLQAMQVKAQREEKPLLRHSNQTRTSKVDEKYLMKDNAENDFRAKLDRIGYNSRITPEELAQKKVLNRPEQAEINAYNIRLKELGRDANANLAAEIPPTLNLPDSDDEWIEVDQRYGLNEVVREKANCEREIERLTNEIAHLKRQGVTHGITKINSKTKDSYSKTQNMLSTSIVSAERELRNYMTSLRRADAAIKTIKELRRLYTIQQKQQFKEEMDAYMTQVATLTSAGLSTQRLPNESDEDYLQRMHDNVQDITTQEQLFDGQLYLMREFIAKLRSLNIPLETVESLTKLMPDDAKEWILAHWPKVHTEFVKTFGTNPYKVKVRDVTEFFGKMHADATTHHLGMIDEDLQQSYDDELDTTFSHNFEKKSAKTARTSRMKIKEEHENLHADDYADNEYNQHMDEYEGTGFRKIGKKIINYDKLMKRNVLDVRHLKKGNIYGFPTATVSDAFVSNVNNLVSGKGVSEDNVAALDNTEQQLFHRLKHVAAIGGTFKDNSGINALKDRLKLVEDEISSGNDSSHLLVEAKNILTTLARQNVITKTEKDRFYKQLTKINN